MSKLNMGFKLSRYWNRLAFAVIGLGERMIWDYTKCNADILPDLVNETTKEMLTTT